MTKFCWHPRSKNPKQVKNLQKPIKICLLRPNLDLILPLEIWISAEFGHLVNFDSSNVCMNGKCLTWVVTISLRNIFNLEQCKM